MKYEVQRSEFKIQDSEFQLQPVRRGRSASRGRNSTRTLAPRLSASLLLLELLLEVHPAAQQLKWLLLKASSLSGTINDFVATVCTPTGFIIPLARIVCRGGNKMEARIVLHDDYFVISSMGGSEGATLNMRRCELLSPRCPTKVLVFSDVRRRPMSTRSCKDALDFRRMNEYE